MPCFLPPSAAWHQRLRPCVGHRPLHPAAPVLVPGIPLLSWLLHYAWPHVTTPVAVAQHVSPFQPHAANSPVCPPLPSVLLCLPWRFSCFILLLPCLCSRLPLRRLRSAGAADRAASHPTKELLRYLPSRASFWKAAYPEFVSLLLLVP